MNLIILSIVLQQCSVPNKEVSVLMYFYMLQLCNTALFLDLQCGVMIFRTAGIYILMFGNILSTFFRTVLLSFLLLVAFFLAFYMAFHIPGMEFSSSPFYNPELTLLTVLTYVTGGADYNEVFGLSHERGRVLATPPFLPVSIILWISFLIIMVILLINMLVS